MRIYDEGEAHGLHYLVMEYIEGKNIGQLIWPRRAGSRRRPPRRIGRQVALGLEHATSQGADPPRRQPAEHPGHRDGTAKLTDLGLAIDLGDLEDIVTRDGATVGTFDYISPEQARHSRSVDTRSDIYSLGCTLYHMISGRVPFPTPSLPEKLYAHQLSEPEPLAAAAPDLPPGFEAVILKLMSKKVEDRYPTALAAAQALEPFVEGAASLSQIVPAPAAPPDPLAARPAPAERDGLGRLAAGLGPGAGLEREPADAAADVLRPAAEGDAPARPRPTPRPSRPPARPPAGSSCRSTSAPSRRWPTRSPASAARPPGPPRRNRRQPPGTSHRCRANHRGRSGRGSRPAPR